MTNTKKTKSAVASNIKETQNIKNKSAQSDYKKYLIVISALIILIILFSAFYFNYYNTSKQTSNFVTFRSNFDTANNVSIMVNYNSSSFPYQIGCATNLIYNIVSSRIKSSSNILFFVVNSTNCTYIKNGLGQVIKNYTYASPASCLNITKKQPTIFINYSAINKTIIKPNAIYISGDGNFLKQCGIASIMK